MKIYYNRQRKHEVFYEELPKNLLQITYYLWKNVVGKVVAE